MNFTIKVYQPSGITIFILEFFTAYVIIEIKHLCSKGIDPMFMSMDEIDRVYDGEWVFIINLQKGEDHSIIGGEVAAHDSNRDKVMNAMLNMKGGGVYIKYAGKVPEGANVLL